MKIKSLIHKTFHGFVHLEHPFHITYLGLVFVEGHSLYALVAGPLCLVVAAAWLCDLLGIEL